MPVSWVMAFVGQKGGTGKSRLAQAFAVEAARAKIDVLLGDMDIGPTSSTMWAETRATNGWEPSVACQRFERLNMQAANGKADLLVMDTAGFADRITKDIAAWSHMVVVPVGADIGDWIPTLDLLQQFEKAGIGKEKLVPAIVRAPSQATATLARQWLTEGGFAPVKHETYFSASYSHAFNIGKGMTECQSEAPRLEALKQVREIGTALQRLQQQVEQERARGRQQGRARAGADRGRG